MKKLALILGMLIMAAGTVWFLNNFGQDKGTTEPIIDDSTISPTKGILSQINSLEEKQWNREQFDKILSDINIKYSHKKLRLDVKEDLEKALHSAYAKSLRLSFENWKDNCAKTSVSKLYKEIKEPGMYDAKCKEILHQAYKEIIGYYEILNVTKKVDQLIQEEFEENSFNSLSQKAEQLPSYFSACSEIREKIYVARENLVIYHEFVLENIDNYSAYKFELKEGETSYRTLQKLRADYGLAQRMGFDFYERKLKTDGFDN